MPQWFFFFQHIFAFRQQPELFRISFFPSFPVKFETLEPFFNDQEICKNHFFVYPAEILQWCSRFLAESFEVANYVNKGVAGADRGPGGFIAFLTWFLHGYIWQQVFNLGEYGLLGIVHFT